MPIPYAVLILTRPQGASQRFAQSLGDVIPKGVQIVVSPLLEIVPIPVLQRIEGHAGVIFTSANGVEHAGAGKPMDAYCVGRETTRRAQQKGWRAQQVGDSAEALYQTLTRQKPEGPLLHLCGVHTRGRIAERLTAANIPTVEATVYDQKAVALTKDAIGHLSGDVPVVVPLFSPRTAALFAEQATGHAPLHVVAMSEAILAQTDGLRAQSRHIADKPNGQAMRDTIANVLRRVEAGGAPQ